MNVSAYVEQLVKAGMSEDAARDFAKGQIEALKLVDDIDLQKGGDPLDAQITATIAELDKLAKGDGAEMPEKKDGESDDDDGKEESDEEVERKKREAEAKTMPEEGDEPAEKAKKLVGDLLKAARAEWIKDVEQVVAARLKVLDAKLTGIVKGQADVLRAQSAITGKLGKGNPIAPRTTQPGDVRVQPSPADDAARSQRQEGVPERQRVLEKAAQVMGNPASPPALRAAARDVLRKAEFDATDRELIDTARASGLMG